MAALMDSNSMNPVGTQGSVDVTASGTVLTPPAGAQRVLFQPLTGTIHWSLAGTATATSGFIMVGGAVPYSLLLSPDTSFSLATTTGTVSVMYQWLA